MFLSFYPIPTWILLDLQLGVARIWSPRRCFCHQIYLLFCFAHWSQKFNNNIFLFVVLPTLGTFIEFGSLILKLSVQTFQPVFLIYRRSNFVNNHWWCTSIYLSFSYPFKFLTNYTHKGYTMRTNEHVTKKVRNQKCVVNRERGLCAKSILFSPNYLEHQSIKYFYNNKISFIKGFARVLP